MAYEKLSGVVTAVLTPFDSQGKPDLSRFKTHLSQLKQDGTDAVLIAGTTGEGPSLSVSERESLVEAALEDAGSMKVIAQTGCASLEDTIKLTKNAFSLGLSEVTILPPFFFKGVTDDGLFAYYQKILEKAVPASGRILLYHIPQVTQVAITRGLVHRLIKANGTRIAGIKDSDGNLEHLSHYCDQFPDLAIFTGNDQLILDALKRGAVGCVTGVVNSFAPTAVDIIDTYSQGDINRAQAAQNQMTAIWRVLEKYQPYTVLLKGLNAKRYQDAGWLDVRPPLDPISISSLQRLISELREIDLPKYAHWLYEPGFPFTSN